MRATLPILLWLLAMACCYAKPPPPERYESDKRLTDLMTKNPEADPRRHPFPNEMSNKKFKGGGNLNITSASEQSSTFAGSKKFNSGTFETRSFLGIKNPWFGKKVYETDKASLWSKSALADADKKFAVKEDKTKPFYQADKKAAASNQVEETKPFVVKGAAQGGVDQLKKNLTIDDVREILNKNH